MIVQDIMTKSPALCLRDTPLAEVARMMVEHDCGAIPVVESQETPVPLGVITDRDIVVRLVAEKRNPLEFRAEDAMSEGAATLTPNLSLQEATLIMERNQVRRAPVVDAQGKVIGIVSQADIALNAPAHEAAELLREVSEEEELAEKIPMGGAYSG